MTVPTDRRVLPGVTLCALAVMLVVSVSACSEESRAQRGLKKVVHEELKQWNKYYRREVRDQVYQSRGRFYRTFKERVDPLVTMRRTNSVDTPYIVTISFTENSYVTKPKAAAREAATDSHFVLQNTRKSEVIYTFSLGTWKKKEVY